MQPAKTNNTHILYSAIVFIVLSASLLAVNLILGTKPMTGDEIWAATAVNGSLLEVIIFTLRFDLHPPVYYMLLDLWAVFGKSDIWLKFFSMVTHAALVASVFFILRKKTVSLAIAVVIVTLTATNPLLLQYSNSLRMYSLISLLSLWYFYFTELHVNKDKNCSWYLFGLGVVLANLHAIGILFVFFHFLHGLLANIKTSARDALRWSFLHIAIAISALGAIANSMLKSVAHASQPNFNDAANAMLNLFTALPNELLALKLVSLLLLLGLLLASKSAARLTLIYLLLPILIFAAISYLLKPLWLERNFAFAIPMLTIAVGLSIHHVKAKVIKVSASSLIVAICIYNTLAWYQSTANAADNNNFVKLTQAIELHSNNNRACILATNPLNTFWALLRYMDKPNWSGPLDVQGPTNSTWSNIIDKLPSSVSSYLKLTGFANQHHSQQFVFTTILTAECQALPMYIVDDINQAQQLQINKVKLDKYGGYTLYSASFD